MIVQEIIDDMPDGIKRVKTYSDEGMKIIKVGTTFIDNFCVDVYPCKYTYAETSVAVDNGEIENDTTNGPNEEHIENNIQE